jgi:transposase-like protein
VADVNPTPSRPTLVRLDPSTVERLAIRTAELVDQRLRRTAVEPQQPPELLTVAEVAARWGVHPNWVYRHARQLGAIRLGDGPCARIRFDREQITRRLNRPPRTATNVSATQSSSSGVKSRETK